MKIVITAFLEPYDKWMRWLGWFFVALSQVFLAASIVVFVNDAMFVRSALQVDGRVTGLVEQPDRNGGVLYRSAVTFRDINGAEHSFVSSAATYPAMNAPGDKVTVYYQPSHPDQAALGSVFELWGTPVILGGMAIGYLVFGLLVLWIAAAIKKQKSIP
jgi:hypothetical protein